MNSHCVIIDYSNIGYKNYNDLHLTINHFIYNTLKEKNPEIILVVPDYVYCKHTDSLETICYKIKKCYKNFKCARVNTKLDHPSSGNDDMMVMYFAIQAAEAGKSVHVLSSDKYVTEIKKFGREDEREIIFKWRGEDFQYITIKKRSFLRKMRANWKAVDHQGYDPNIDEFRPLYGGVQECCESILERMKKEAKNKK